MIRRKKSLYRKECKKIYAHSKQLKEQQQEKVVNEDAPNLVHFEEMLTELRYAMNHPEEYEQYSDIDKLMRDMFDD